MDFENRACYILTPMISENITENAGFKAPLMIADNVPVKK